MQIQVKQSYKVKNISSLYRFPFVYSKRPNIGPADYWSLTLAMPLFSCLTDSHCPVTVVQRYRDGVCSLLFHSFFIICHSYIPLHLYIYRPYVVVSMRMRYMCAFLLGESQSLNDLFSTNTVVTERSLLLPSSSSSAKGKRERASCPRICASSSVVRPRERRLQRLPRKGRPARRRVRDRAI